MPEGKSEIPADIEAKARKVVSEDLGMDLPGLERAYVESIADAILAERETCALIAESAGRQALAGYHVEGPESIIRKIVWHIRLGIPTKSSTEER